MKNSKFFNLKKNIFLPKVKKNIYCFPIAVQQKLFDFMYTITTHIGMKKSYSTYKKIDVSSHSTKNILGFPKSYNKSCSSSCIQ